MKERIFELPIGLRINGNVHKKVELLKSNGVAERVFVQKMPESPYTWQGNVLSIAVKSIGDCQVGIDARNQYVESGSITIPDSISKLTLADVNTLLVEIHRRVWQSFIPKQKIMCPYCGRELIADIDLDKIALSDEDKVKLDNITDYEHIVVELEDGLELPAMKTTDKEEYKWISQTTFNRLVFRAPLLEDAIRNEKFVTDNILFWRRIAMDCLVSIDVVENGEVKDSVPNELFVFYGLDIFNSLLTGTDLKAIRNAITEYLPTLPYAYYEECSCDQHHRIPMVMEASSFFSE